MVARFVDTLVFYLPSGTPQCGKAFEGRTLDRPQVGVVPLKVFGTPSFCPP